MKSLTNRRTLLMAAGVLAVGTSVLAEAGAAQSADIRGTVTFEGNEVIPKGNIEIYLDDPAVSDPAARALAPKTQLKSNGKAKEIVFSLSLPASATTSPTRQIVARLERGDSWLLARGSARLRGGTPIAITLNTVMY
jgi:hypothetical protein